jgi:uncharacterized protein YceK
MKRFLLLIIVAIFMLSGCSSIGSGLITQKTNYPAHYNPVLYCAAYGVKGTCSVWITRQDYIPESWKFDIKDQKNTGWVYVNKQTYNDYEVGDYYEEK